MLTQRLPSLVLSTLLNLGLLVACGDSEDEPRRSLTANPDSDWETRCVDTGDAELDEFIAAAAAAYTAVRQAAEAIQPACSAIASDLGVTVDVDPDAELNDALETACHAAAEGIRATSPAGYDRVRCDFTGTCDTPAIECSAQDPPAPGQDAVVDALQAHALPICTFMSCNEATTLISVAAGLYAGTVTPDTPSSESDFLRQCRIDAVASIARAVDLITTLSTLSLEPPFSYCAPPAG